MRVFHLTTDLLLSSQAAAIAKQRGVEYSHGRDLHSVFIDDASQAVDLVLWDLGCLGEPLAEAVARLKAQSPAPRIVAYGPHVHEERLAAARAAGCDEVLSRGQFTRELPRLIG
jgi:DNA-binding NarL/FixJ family response regulator